MAGGFDYLELEEHWQPEAPLMAFSMVGFPDSGDNGQARTSPRPPSLAIQSFLCRSEKNDSIAALSEHSPEGRSKQHIKETVRGHRGQLLVGSLKRRSVRTPTWDWSQESGAPRTMKSQLDRSAGSSFIQHGSSPVGLRSGNGTSSGAFDGVISLRRQKSQLPTSSKISKTK